MQNVYDGTVVYRVFVFTYGGQAVVLRTKIGRMERYCRINTYIDVYVDSQIFIEFVEEIAVVVWCRYLKRVFSCLVQRWYILYHVGLNGCFIGFSFLRRVGCRFTQEDWKDGEVMSKKYVERRICRQLDFIEFVEEVDIGSSTVSVFEKNISRLVRRWYMVQVSV